jgi:hypothetical protein
LEDNINTTQKNREALSDASKKLGQEVNTKTKCMFMSCHQSAGQNHKRKIANKSSENVTEFRCLGMRVKNQNLIQEEIKTRLNSGNECYHSIQNLLPSHQLSKHVKIRI